MLGAGPEVTSTGVEFPVLLHEISMIYGRWKREREKCLKDCMVSILDIGF